MYLKNTMTWSNTKQKSAEIKIIKPQNHFLHVVCKDYSFTSTFVLSSFSKEVFFYNKTNNPTLFNTYFLQLIIIILCMIADNLIFNVTSLLIGWIVIVYQLIDKLLFCERDITNVFFMIKSVKI